MDFHEHQLRSMLTKVEEIEDKQNLWKDKYRDLEEMVDYVELLRKSLKTTKKADQQISVLE